MAILLPLPCGSESQGVVIVIRQTEAPPSPDHLKELETVAAGAAAVIALAESLEDARRNEAAARQASAAREQFVAMLAHELQNPIAAILGGLAVLRRAGVTDGRVARSLDVMERNARLQSRLVKDLMDLSRIARGKVRLRRSVVALEPVVEPAVEAQRAAAEAAGLSLTCRCEPGLWVYGDVDRLEQILHNLLNNAIKFTPPDGSVSVSVTRVPGGGGLPDAARLCVEDTGIGVDETLRGRLFEMFLQGGLDERPNAGLGIGLALVRSLVELHDGRVWVESEGTGKGSRFIVELPLVPAP